MSWVIMSGRDGGLIVQILKRILLRIHIVAPRYGRFFNIPMTL